jgi:predicted AAA+ superfamily ATPase
MLLAQLPKLEGRHVASLQEAPQEILRILGEQNPWHVTGVVPPVLAPPVERPLAQCLWRRLRRDRPRRFQLILGARRVGKTTVMYQTGRHLLQDGLDPDRLWWLRLDHPVLLREDLGALVQFVLETAYATSDDPLYLMLDELVYARDWDLWLKTFYDEQWPVRVVATSSATAALRDRRLESGVGRWSEQYLAPCGFTEFLDLLHRDLEVPVERTLGETLRRLPSRVPLRAGLPELRRSFMLIGGFPELLRAEREQAEGRDDGVRLLQSQQLLRADAVERAVYKDIPQSYGVENPMRLERLLYVLAAQVTGLLSPTKIGAELDLSQPTFDRYLSYLEQAFLVFTLPGYASTEETRQRRGRKLYFVDGAVRNAALQRGLAPLSDPNELGQLTENLVAAALHSMAQQTGQRLFHWREQRREVDLVLDHPERPLAFDLGSSISHSRVGLQALVGRHPRFAGGAYLVTPDAPVRHPDSGSGIGTLPLDLLLVAAGRQAEDALLANLG